MVSNLQLDSDTRSRCRRGRGLIELCEHYRGHITGQDSQDWNANGCFIDFSFPMSRYGHRRNETAQRQRKVPRLSSFETTVKGSLGEKKASKCHATRRIEVSKLFTNSLICLLLVVFGLPQSISGESSPSPVGQPSVKPTMVFTSSAFPSTSLPTNEPTKSFFPSSVPSSSFAPSDLPSNYPTPEPTFETPIVSGARFRQRFIVENGRVFFPTELGFIESLYIGSTANFVTDHSDVELKVETICNVTYQVGGPKLTRRHLEEGKKWTMLRRGLQEFEYVDVDYDMLYSSVYINVTDYPISFQQYINKNNQTIVSKMQTLGLNVTQAQHAQRFVVITTAPSVAPGPIPTAIPSFAPSSSNSPSYFPSSTTSLSPTTQPTDQTPLPTASVPSPSEGDGPPTETIVIVVSVVVAGSIVLVGLLIHYRKRAVERERRFQSDAVQRTPEGIWNRGVQPTSYGTPSPNNTGYKTNNYSEKSPQVVTRDGMASPSESLISNQSLLSAGNSIGGDSGDEADATYGLADEFDQYKDQNLEKMRADVEGNLTGFDSMMSQALTRALIDEDDDHIVPTELLWGGSGRLAGAEIEASALGEVTDWLKRKENANVEEK
jgi:hypothetical protein